VTNIEPPPPKLPGLGWILCVGLAPGVLLTLKN
jgi:hypothetical protein